MPTFAPYITPAGLAAAIAADGLGTELAITHVAIGSGQYDPAGALTALVDRREKATVGSGSSAIPGQFSVIATFTGYGGATYNLGEIGFYAGDPDAGGILFAVASRAGLFYDVRSSSVASFTAAYDVALSGVPSGSITVTVDPDAGAAGGLLGDHVAAANPHPQYLQAIDAVPVSAVQGFMRATAPNAKWLTLSGQLVNRADYPALYAQAVADGIVVSEATWAATSWGCYSVGNGTTTFRLPDFRGEFVRGWSNSRSGVDTGRTLGQWIADKLKSHTHLLHVFSRAIDGSDEEGDNTVATASSGVSGYIDATGDNETAPRSIAVLYCVKALP